MKIKNITTVICQQFSMKIFTEGRRLDTKLMFPSPITGGLRDPSAITRKLHRMQRRAGIPQIRFHDLRHGFATLSIEQGMDIKTISHMLGHTDAGFICTLQILCSRTWRMLWVTLSIKRKRKRETRSFSSVRKRKSLITPTSKI